MKIIVFVLSLLVTYQTSASEIERTPLQVVNARMEAYNNHNMDAFLDTYSEDIQVFTYPDIPLGEKGKEHIAFIFEPMFAEGAVHVEIHSQLTQGNYVINHETVTYNGSDKKYVSIYEVLRGKIVSVRFVRE